MQPYILLLALAACGADDADGDGYAVPYDCDDDAPAVHPGAAEACNQRDDNCDGAVDEGAPADAPTWYADADGDGFGAAAPTLVACEAPAGWADAPGDCDEGDPAVHPGATEVCGNGLDDDCDGRPGACRLTGRMSADEADVVLLGGWLTGAGSQVDLADITGDGVAELLVGEPYAYDSAECQSAVYGWTGDRLVGRVALSAAPFRRCDAEEYGLGTDLAVADIDGDGVDDLLVTTPDESYAYPSEGLVLAWYGPLALGDGWWWTVDSAINGGSDAYLFGTAVSAADYDGDGAVDIAASLPYDDALVGNGGAVYGFAGPLGRGTRMERADAAAAIEGTVEQGYFGMVLRSLPDADGDGDDELVVASPAENGSAVAAGAVRVYTGFLAGDDAFGDADFTVYGTQASENLGFVLDVGDLDGDGRGDLVLGTAWGGDGSGAVLAWFGPLAGTEDALASAADLAIAGVDAWGHFGAAVAVDDVDGDGQDDLLVGSNGVGEGADPTGYLLVWYGPLAAGTLAVGQADLVIAGVEPEGWFGYGEPRAGDLDGDGVPELVVGAPQADLQGLGSDSGAIYVFRGRGF